MIKHGMLVSVNNISYLVIELTEQNITDYVDNPSNIDFGFYGLSQVKEHNNGNIYDIGNYKVCFSLLTQHIKVDNIKIVQESFEGNIEDIK